MPKPLPSIQPCKTLFGQPSPLSDAVARAHALSISLILEHSEPDPGAALYMHGKRTELRSRGWRRDPRVEWIDAAYERASGPYQGERLGADPEADASQIDGSTLQTKRRGHEGHQANHA